MTTKPTKENILKFAKGKKEFKTSEVTSFFNVSRQHASKKLSELVKTGELLKFGKTSKTFYVTEKHLIEFLKDSATSAELKLKNKNLEEHKIISQFEDNFPSLSNLKENVKSIFTYAFSEMLNNAIEHSRSENIKIFVSVKNDIITFSVNDFGIGVFKNIKEKKKLNNELEAIQDLLKGKTTTQPKSHSGEGIFFTSKVGDRFSLESFDYQLIIDNKIDDVFVSKITSPKKGTLVTFSIDINSNRHLNDIFKEYTSKESDFGFNKTIIKIKLYTVEGIFVSRSQARRVFSGLDKFKSIILDFDKVPMIGQAFADEVFRVFQKKHPKIKIQSINMNEGIKFMIDRVE